MSNHDNQEPGNGQERLEFPEWNMDDSTNRISLEAALQLCEDYQAQFRTLVNSQPRPEKCLVEFIL